jgi:hypothetical protein
MIKSIACSDNSATTSWHCMQRFADSDSWICGRKKKWELEEILIFKPTGHMTRVSAIPITIQSDSMRTALLAATSACNCRTIYGTLSPVCAEHQPAGTWPISLQGRRCVLRLHLGVGASGDHTIERGTFNVSDFQYAGRLAFDFTTTCKYQGRPSRRYGAI